MTEIFYRLLDEASFTNDMLRAGVTQIGQANYTRKGMYFQAFTSLSTGLERIGKLCLILDYYIQNQSNFPNSKYLKNEIGHNLLKLQEKSIEIVNKYSFELKFSKKFEDIHSSILRILSDFSMGDRYSNINFISNQKENDPIAEWNRYVDNLLFERKVSKFKKDKILLGAKIAGKLLGPYSSVLHTSESREKLNDIESSSYQTGKTEAVAPYRRLYVLHIVRYWSELIRKLQWEAQDIERKFNKEDIPFFSEFFAIFYNSDSYLKTRKIFYNN